MKALKFEEYPFYIPNQKKIENKLNILLDKVLKASNAKDASVAIKKWDKEIQNIETNFGVIYVLYSCNTGNEKYKLAQNKTDEIGPVVADYQNKFNKIVTAYPFRKDLEKEFGEYLFKMYDASLKSFDSKIIPDMIEENKLVSEYDAILGGAQIEFRGSFYNLSQLGKFTADKDRKTRREAAMAMDKWLGENEKAIGDIYDKLVHLRDSMAKKLGYKNFVELGYLRLGRMDYDAQMVSNYRAQIAKYVVPLCNKLYRKQIQQLGIKKPQYFDYNLRFADGNPIPAGNKDYLVNAAKNMYEDLGKETGEFINFMIDNHLMDLEARKGKAPGGYCTYFPNYKAPFIFSNFNGTDGDVNVLCHEGGHALQAYLSSKIKVPEYRSPTLEACEIHSMSMEFFAWPYMDAFFKGDATKYKYMHLADSIEFLPYGITIDEFQHWVYENPDATHLQRCAKFKEIESRYTPHKKYDCTPTLDHGAYWIRQSHVFGSPFYYIDYTLAQVVAFEFTCLMHKNHEKAWKKYIRLCKFGGQAPFVTLLAKNHLRNPFDEGNVKKVITPLKKILADLEKDLF